MQHAMARQAQAERERRAKIINAEGEFQAAARLSEAADVISKNPTTIQLRYLQTMSEIGKDNSTVVFPLPMDLIKPLLEAGPRCAPARERERPTRERSTVGACAFVTSPAPMDLLEYQGKQLFARHGVPVPSGAPATTVEEAVAAADEIGYPCVVKAQVQIGGRGKAGGIKVAKDRQEAETHAKAILGMDIRGHTVHEVWIEAASDIAAEYYASIVFDRSAKRPLVMLSTQGGMDIEEVADKNPTAHRPAARGPAARVPGLPRAPARVRGGRRRGRRPPDRCAARPSSTTRSSKKRRCSSRSTR